MLDLSLHLKLEEVKKNSITYNMDKIYDLN